MEKYKVGVIGGTGIVGQRFVTLPENRSWFQLAAIAASSRSAGKIYEEAADGRWALDVPIPEEAEDMVVLNAETNIDQIAAQVDFVFSAVDMKEEGIQALKEAYTRRRYPVASNNSAHRQTSGVPMVVPKINLEHLRVIEAQRRRLGTKRGSITVKSNCSLQSYVPALHPLRAFGLKQVLVCTYQAISGVGKTFETWPEMMDNAISYIDDEEEKSEQEPLRLWGRMEDDVIVNAAGPSITTQYLRVPTSNDHMAAVFTRFRNKPLLDEAKAAWAGFQDRIQELALPSTSEQFLHYFEEPDRPQTRLDQITEGGMTVCIGRLRPDTQYDYKFVYLSHNALRDVADGAVLFAELLCAEGYIQGR